jgi:hypothetical protein
MQFDAAVLQHRSSDFDDWRARIAARQAAFTERRMLG